MSAKTAECSSAPTVAAEMTRHYSGFVTYRHPVSPKKTRRMWLIQKRGSLQARISTLRKGKLIKAS